MRIANLRQKVEIKHKQVHNTGSEWTERAFHFIVFAVESFTHENANAQSTSNNSEKKPYK